jgi:hypothetical protein
MIKFVKLIFLTFFCFSSLLYAEQVNGFVTVFNHTAGLNYQSYKVDTKSFITNGLEQYKTYELDVNTFEVTTKTNESVDLYFVNGNVVKISENSEFRIDLMNVTLKNKHPYPSKVDVESYNLNLALMEGEGYFDVVKSENDQCLLQTPLVNLELSKGKFYIQTTKNSVMAYILEGSLGVLDNVTNKKEEIQSGNAVLIRPSPKLSPKQLELFADKMTTIIKKAKPETFKVHLENINQLKEACTAQILLVQVNDKIIGVKIK